MRGRKPVPTALKLLRGNPGKRPLNRLEPTYPLLPTRCPAEIVDLDAQAEWRRTVVPAIRRRQITQADRALAMAHAELYATWRSQLVLAAQHAHVIATTAGNPIPNPARGMANKTLTLLIKVDSELGLTPSSRSRVKTSAQDPEENPFARNGQSVA